MMPSQSADQPSQFLMLGLAEEIFAIEATLIREILDPAPVAEVPGARPFLRGVVNVRGKIVPIADLRVRFGMPATALSADTRFVVLEITLAGEPVTLAIIADKVHDVTGLSLDSMGKAPPIGMQWEPEFITCIGKWRDDFIIIPNLENVFN
jgi:purine-binding chemotaxis protein CheW